MNSCSSAAETGWVKGLEEHIVNFVVTNNTDVVIDSTLREVFYSCVLKLNCTPCSQGNILRIVYRLLLGLNTYLFCYASKISL